ncbi:MAG TPA: head GIN domain-containing protein [Pyrinomonadaceae bacterium]|nr:head GIN domain-containing protein [Pyrinomonadaceae bacterium]
MRKLALLFLLLPLVAAGCHHGMRAEVKGSGKRVMQKREISPFTSISTEGAFEIEVTCQKDPSVEVEGDDNVLEFVTAEVRGNELRLKSSKSYSTGEPVRFKITVPNLEGLSVSGAGRIDIKGMQNQKFEIDSNGAPNIIVSGSTNTVDIDSNGAGKIDTHNLRASRAVVDSKGVSRIDLDVANQLDVTISGPSTVTYSGDPVVNKTVNGPGKIEKRASEGA